MTPMNKIVSAKPELALEKCLERMLEGGFRHMPVGELGRCAFTLGDGARAMRAPRRPRVRPAPHVRWPLADPPPPPYSSFNSLLSPGLCMVAASRWAALLWVRVGPALARRLASLWVAPA